MTLLTFVFVALIFCSILVTMMNMNKGEKLTSKIEWKLSADGVYIYDGQ